MVPKLVGRHCWMQRRFSPLSRNVHLNVRFPVRGFEEMERAKAKKLGIFAIAAMTGALPQVGWAQSSTQGPSSASIQDQVKSDLEQAGCANIRIMPDSFLVRATDKNGNPVMMVINPDSVTAAMRGTPGGIRPLNVSRARLSTSQPR